MLTAVAPSVVLDVFPASPTDLRARARAKASRASLPGGMTLEESPSAVRYELDAPGGWSASEADGEWRFSHPDGLTLVLDARGLTLRVPDRH